MNPRLFSCFEKLIKLAFSERTIKMYYYHLHYKIKLPLELKKWGGYPITESYVFGAYRSRHGFVICKRTEDISSNGCIRIGLEDIARKFNSRVLTGLGLFALGGLDLTVTPSEEETKNFQKILEEVQRKRT